MEITKSKIDELRNIINNGDKNQWENMLSNFSELVDDLVYVFKNPEWFDENQKYAFIETFREMCRFISEDNRATGTLMKQLDL